MQRDWNTTGSCPSHKRSYFSRRKYNSSAGRTNCFLLKKSSLPAETNRLDHSGWSNERHQQYDCQQLLVEALNLHLNRLHPQNVSSKAHSISIFAFLQSKKKLYFCLATWRKLSVDCILFVLSVDQIVPSIWNCSPTADLPDHIERYSRKVFVGGLPPDIDEGKKA